MEQRLNFNKEVDDLARIDAFFQNLEILQEEQLNETLDVDTAELQRTKSA